MDADADTLIEQAQNLIAEATRCAALSDPSCGEEFLEISSRYVSSLVEWNKLMQVYVSAHEEIANDGVDNFSKGNVRDKADLYIPSKMRETIFLLEEAHRQVLVAAEAHKETLGSMLGDVHKKSKAIKTYIDPHPFRKSLTGRRKG